MNKHQKKWNEEVYRRLNVPTWHESGITGNGVDVAVIGYGACLIHKKPYITPVNDIRGGSYHDGDELIHEVAPSATIQSLNMKDKGGWGFRQCLEWVVANKPDIVCMSFVLSGWDPELEELSRQAYENGTILISSTGNNESSVRYPAKNRHWIAVGAYDEKRSTRAGYSNYGPGLTCVGYTDLTVEAQEGYYIPISHTSGATQAIAGMAALLKEKLNITPVEFEKFIAGEKIWEPDTGYGLFVLPKTIPERKTGGETMELRKGKIQYAVIHHSARLNEYTAAEVLRVHKARGFATYGYNKLIEPDGKVVIGRDPKYRGAHVYNEKAADPQYWNENALGYCLVWNGEEKPFPDVMYQVLANELKRDGFKPEQIRLHKEVGATLCPGKCFDKEKLLNCLKEGSQVNKPKKTDWQNHPLRWGIGTVVEKGIMVGEKPDGSVFRPDDKMTRAEFANAIAKLFEKGYLK